MFPNIDAERTTSILEGLSEIDTFLMGRVTYDGMAAHWLTADDEIAPLMNRAGVGPFMSRRVAAGTFPA